MGRDGGGGFHGLHERVQRLCSVVAGSRDDLSGFLAGLALGWFVFRKRPG